MEENHTNLTNKDGSLSLNELQIYVKWAHQKLFGMRTDAVFYPFNQPTIQHTVTECVLSAS